MWLMAWTLSVVTDVADGVDTVVTDVADGVDTVVTCG